MRNRAVVLLVGMFVGGAVAAPAISARSVPPVYANVEVLSVDAATRVVVIRNSKGARETFVLDDELGGAAGVKAGDHVMLTVRGEPGRQRISAITRVTASPAPPAVMAASTPPASRGTDVTRGEIRDRFAAQVSLLSQQARPVDSNWASFVTSCDVKESSSSEGGRDWFGLWDGRAKADLSSGFCRDLFNQIVTAGEGIKRGMVAAEDVARQTLPVGEMRDILKLNSMEWEGWALPAPKLEP
jgi:hypothetical protein